LGRSGAFSILLLAGGCLGAIGCAAAMADLQSADPAVRRLAVLEIANAKRADATQRLAAALDDPNPVVRRTAARGLRGLGVPATAALSTALGNSDSEVRMIAFLALNDLGGLGLPELAVAAADQDNTALRMSAVQLLAKLPASRDRDALLDTATRDSNEQVRGIAAKILRPFPFFRKMESIRDGADHIINVTQTIPLPADGWTLKFDPEEKGHSAAEKWYAPALNDADWQAVSIGRFWDDFGFKHKTGIGWYRGRFTLPEKPVLNAAEMHFGAVDETTWVWLNGEYAGQFDLGPAGWDVAFRIDVTPFLKWGQENQITVRVLNTAQAGGIWKPVNIEVVKLGN
jgi:hypothetical protein